MYTNTFQIWKKTIPSVGSYTFTLLRDISLLLFIFRRGYYWRNKISTCTSLRHVNCIGRCFFIKIIRFWLIYTVACFEGSSEKKYKKNHYYSPTWQAPRMKSVIAVMVSFYYSIFLLYYRWNKKYNDKVLNFLNHQS